MGYVQRKVRSRRRHRGGLVTGDRCDGWVTVTLATDGAMVCPIDDTPCGPHHFLAHMLGAHPGVVKALKAQMSVLLGEADR